MTEKEMRYDLDMTIMERDIFAESVYRVIVPINKLSIYSLRISTDL